MKKYSLKPNDDNVLRMLQDNSLGRNELLFKFVELIGKLDDDCWTVAVNGDWGSGKTFFVKQAKLIFDALNPQSNFNLIDRDKFQEILPEKIKLCDSFATVYYDAWLNDKHDDPILSLVYATIASNHSNFSPEKKRNILKIAADLGTVWTKRNMSNIVEDLKGEDLLKELKAAEHISNMVRDFVNALIIELGNRLVIFIDELDRCKPDYAIRFLERIKHYFDDERITFVFSVNFLQLQSTVKNYYGADFDATRYLDKFFDLRCPLPMIEIEQFMRIRLNFRIDTSFEFICIETAKYFNFSLRECENYVRLVRIAYNSSKEYWNLPSENKFAITYILPILVALQIKNMKTYYDFISGKKSEIMIDILLQVALGDFRYDFFDYLNIKSDNIQPSAIEAELSKVYNSIFLFSGDNQKQRIGNMMFSNETRKYLENILSLLSNISDYNS